MAVHPHARGEHDQQHPVPPLSRGSSPRPWGTPGGGCGDRRHHRFIPTPVGNTTFAASVLRPRSVHPHARGEHYATIAGAAKSYGSSPRPWGTRRHRRVDAPVVRFIPTPVGNTARPPPPRPHCPVHPHARGEHAGLAQGSEAFHGSSPRPWGTLAAPGCAQRRRRFIPTPVGNTLEITQRAGRPPVHPHARGEHARGGRRWCLTFGSSPRPWGTPDGPASVDLYARFIPTPVGNTQCAAPACCRRTVHPHARGEHDIHGSPGVRITGSSPRPWGTRYQPESQEFPSRFIPTPVGNTGADRAGGGCVPVHPHARGEHTSAARACACVAGSSPRPWGTPGGLHRRERAGRFIPTPVGNTPACGRARLRGSVHPHARGEHLGLK